MCEGPLHNTDTPLSYNFFFFVAHFIDEFYLCVDEICNDSNNNNNVFPQNITLALKQHSCLEVKGWEFPSCWNDVVLQKCWQLPLLFQGICFRPELLLLLAFSWHKMLFFWYKSHSCAVWQSLIYTVWNDKKRGGPCASVLPSLRRTTDAVLLVFVLGVTEFHVHVTSCHVRTKHTGITVAR